ncbi:MAG: RluA family pseudouridine synthase [Clostridium sp.]|nr:RluA family pseudouridine synthase [Clostridium sp.]MCM1444654.1 RluA family pseudouridine synthase [Candidatus Amulumruptor caecigallinarius]
MQYKVEEEGKRIDNYLSDILNKSRSKVQNMLKNNQIKINGSYIKNSYIVKQNDIIDIKELDEKGMSADAEDIPLDIVYEDNDIIIVNKQNGLVVHPAIGNTSGTLVNALVNHSESLSTVNGEFRPGIVHRIDAYTTGLLVVAKNDYAHEFLAKQLEEKTTHRKYIALVWGVINNSTGTIDAPIGRDKTDRKKMTVTSENSKNAITHFKVLERYKNATLIELELETGRTHQIRVHMDYIKHPVVNDPVYGRKKLIDETGQCLHAKELGFIHPTTKEYVSFDSDLPETFINILNIFKEE